MGLTTSFYNTFGRYYSTSGTTGQADSAYYAAKNRRWRMDITAEQMATIVSEVGSASVRVYNRNYYNSEFTFYCVASKQSSWSSVLTEGNYFGQTETQSITPYPTWTEFNLDCSTCFQYAQENWPNEAWYLWVIWTKGGGDVAFIGYDNDTYADYRCPYFTITYATDFSSVTPYVFTTKATTISYPSAAMTAASSQNCIASASSQYSDSYAAWRAFDKSTSTNTWASARGVSEAWLMLQFPQKLYSISVIISNRADHSTLVNGPVSGTIQGSNDGSTFTDIGTFSGRDGATKGASSTITCSNETEGYTYVRIYTTNWDRTTASSSQTECCIGECAISGRDIPTAGGWKKCIPYVYEGAGSWVELTPTAYLK